MGDLTYDLFISYSSTDAAWATKLETDLSARNVKVFRDQTRLQVGRRWERDLQRSLDASRHFVVIWSGKAKESDWVQKEMARFDMHAEQDPQRRLICLNLEGTNPAYSFYQAIDTLKASADPLDASGVDNNRWNDVVSRIVTAIEDDDQSEQIPTAVLAMTSREADPAERGGLGARDLDMIQEAFSIPSDSVQGRYGDSRLDWKPYGGTLTIRTMLDTLIGEVNTIVKGKKFRWSLVGDEFWADMTTGGPTDVATTLSNARLSLVVVDALSLRSPDVKDRAIMLLNSLRVCRCAWIFVPPLPSEPQMLNYRKAIRGWTVGMLDEYFNPPIPRLVPFKPHVGLFCGDDAEMRRLVQTVISEHRGPDDRTPKSAYTQFQQGQ